VAVFEREKKGGGLGGRAYSFATSFAEAMAVKKASEHKLIERVGIRV
jgi:hypothetical protein